MALTEEQAFLSLWWGDEPEAALPSVCEALQCAAQSVHELAGVSQQ